MHCTCSVAGVKDAVSPRQSRLFQQLFLAGTLICFATTASAQLANDPGHAAVTDICTEDSYLSKLALAINRRLDETRDAIPKLKNQARRWRLAAATETDGKRRCLLGVLKGLAQEMIVDNKAAAANAQLSITAALEQIQLQRGRLEAAHQLSKTKIQVQTGTVHTGDSWSHNPTLKLETTTSEAETCDLKKQRSSSPPTAITVRPDKLISITLTDLSKLDKVISIASLKAMAQQNCVNDGSGQTEGQALGSCAFHASSGSINFQHSKPEYSKYKTAVSIFTSNDARNKCDDALNGPTDDWPPAKHLAKVACDALMLKSEQRTLDNADGDTLSKEPLIVEFIRNYDDDFKGVKDPANSTAAKALHAYIKKQYGQKHEDFKKTFEDDIDKRKAPTRDGIKTNLVDISDITTDKAAALTLALIMEQQIAREKKAYISHASTSPTDAKTAEDCKEEKDKDKCNEKNGCEFKDGECKAIEGVKVENDGKTTNTTGSNFLSLTRPLFGLHFLL
uniref:Variant surface glycoprotein 455 n=1 Tax=Trypanosoma brucei TaxID=5691 RepID=M4T037_9TRYP|nr:variant surface glycoprotein 455 [Trypanosoma brucei]